MYEKITTLEGLNAMNRNTMMEQLGIEYLDAKIGYVKAKMPVDNRTKQPMGLLHGGASIALAESVGSIGSAMMVDLATTDVRGAQMTANHIRAAKEGWVIAEARILHQGSNTHVWDIEIRSEDNLLISICRLTNFILPRKV